MDVSLQEIAAVSDLPPMISTRTNLGISSW